VPLFEVTNKTLTHIRTVRAGADLYEKEIEDLLWDNLEPILGETLFPVARQPRLVNGGIPDIVALDESGRVVVIEVKRDVDRGQLAQCLEYAGWARTTSLDELAGLYAPGPAAFFQDWQQFTDSTTPMVLMPSPRLVLVAHDFHGRTRSALDFLQENHLPITVYPVTIYEDATGRRFVDVEAEHDPAAATASTKAAETRTAPNMVLFNGRRCQVSDLLDHGLIEVDEEVVWTRPRLGQTYKARILANGDVELSDGRALATPSQAACVAADIPAYDGWHAWHLPRLGGVALDELRQRLVATGTAEDADDERRH
jgi:hypothetical protein